MMISEKVELNLTEESIEEASRDADAGKSFHEGHCKKLLMSGIDM